eukprot:15208604-Heterocapsa_arctica.AAC.1
MRPQEGHRAARQRGSERRAHRVRAPAMLVEAASWRHLGESLSPAVDRQAARGESRALARRDVLLACFAFRSLSHSSDSGVPEGAQHVLGAQARDGGSPKALGRAPSGAAAED